MSDDISGTTPMAPVDTTPADGNTTPMPAVRSAADDDTTTIEPTDAQRETATADERPTEAIEQIPASLADFEAEAPTETIAEVETATAAEPATEPTTTMDAGSAAEGRLGAVAAHPITPTSEPEPTPAATVPPASPAATVFPAAGPVPPTWSAPAAPQPTPAVPTGPNAPTIVFGLIGIAVGAVGLLVGLQFSYIASTLFLMNPGTLTAMACAAFGGLLVVVAIIWAVVKAVASHGGRSPKSPESVGGSPDDRKVAATSSKG